MGPDGDAGDQAMKPAALLLTLALALGGCTATEKQAATLVDPAGAEALIESTPEMVVLDVRTPEEVAEGTLPGAIAIDFYSPDFAAQVAELDRDAPYLVYCRSGSRSGQATQIMADLGFTQVSELEGGILSWIGAGEALTTD